MRAAGAVAGDSKAYGQFRGLKHRSPSICSLQVLVADCGFHRSTDTKPFSIRRPPTSRHPAYTSPSWCDSLRPQPAAHTPCRLRSGQNQIRWGAVAGCWHSGWMWLGWRCGDGRFVQERREVMAEMEMDMWCGQHLHVCTRTTVLGLAEPYFVLQLASTSCFSVLLSDGQD